MAIGSARKVYGYGLRTGVTYEENDCATFCLRVALVWAVILVAGAPATGPSG